MMMPTSRTTRRPAWTWIAVGCGAALAYGLPLSAGAETPPAAAPHDITIKLSDVSAQGQLLRVPVNKAVTVDFNVPIREARLAKSEIAEVTAISPRQLLLTGKSFGTTQLIVWVNEAQQRVFDVAVDLELERMVASIRTAVPRARVQAHALLDAVVLTGTVPDADSAKRVMEVANVYSTKVMNQIQVAGVQQVLLHCTVAEVSRRAARQLGFNGWMAGDDFRDVFFLSNLDQINPSNIGAVADASASGRVPIPFAVGEDGIPVNARTTLSLGFPRVQLQVFMEALRENGLLRVLSEPNLVAINGQEADFLAGGEFPVPIPSRDGIAIEYREFGVKLNFTPAVLSENRIRLKISPEVSEPDFTTAVTVLGTTVPGLAKRRVETVVELGSGQTFAIGGLLSERVRAVSRAVPGLGDVPILGALFRSIEFQSDETELVVLVTPELVEPIGSDQVTYVPGANLVTPNDFELFLMGQLEGHSGREVRKLQPRVNGSWPVRPDDLYGPAAALKLRGPLGPAGSEEGS
jgi:pilus assembly protein CpaC